MRLVWNWQDVARRAYSMWVYYLIAFAEVASIGFVFIVGVAPTWMSFLVLLLAGAGVVARLIHQDNVP